MKKVLAQLAVPLGAVKGLYYPKKIVSGIKHAKQAFKAGGPLSAIAVATLKGNGKTPMFKIET